MSPRYCLFVLFLILPVHAKFSSHSHGSHGGGTHRYPSSTGLSGTGTHGSHATTYHHAAGHPSNTQTHHTTNTFHHSEVHHHHHYSPPQHINYGAGYHPVYQQTPPSYVYVYKDSGSRFDNLLTGLALYNLGRMSAHHDSYDHGYGHSYGHREYKQNPGEICKLAISKSNGEYEETRIDCKLMTSFIWEAEKEQNRVVNTNTITTTTVVNSTANGTVTTIQNSTVEALAVRGPSIQVTQDMKCYLIRHARDSSVLKKNVDCGLLQAYAVNSFRSYSTRNVPQVVILFLITILNTFQLIVF